MSDVVIPQIVIPRIVAVRACTPDDASTLSLIASATLLETFAGIVPGHALLAHCANKNSVAAFASHLSQTITRAWLAEVAPGAAPVGYAMLTEPDFPPELVQAGDLELRRIYVFSKFHGSGAGRRMMEAAVASAREQGATRFLLGVHPENYRAHAFYRKSGFVEIGRRKFLVGAETFQDPVFALTL